MSVFATPTDLNSGTVTGIGDGVYSLTAGKYTVTLTPTGNATKGFAVVTIAPQSSSQMLMLASAGSEQQQATPTDIKSAGTYSTPQLFDESGAAKPYTFTITIDAPVTMTVEAYWGEQQTGISAVALTDALDLTDGDTSSTKEEETSAPTPEEKETATPSDLQDKSQQGEAISTDSDISE